MGEGQPRGGEGKEVAQRSEVKIGKQRVSE